MQIKTEDLKDIYKKGMLYCIAAFGEEPDSLIINIDGSLNARWYHEYYDDDIEIFSIDDLNSDLIEVANKKKIREDEENKKIPEDKETNFKKMLAGGEEYKKRHKSFFDAIIKNEKLRTKTETSSAAIYMERLKKSKKI